VFLVDSRNLPDCRSAVGPTLDFRCAVKECLLDFNESAASNGRTVFGHLSIVSGLVVFSPMVRHGVLDGC